jgi:hypothetical protein
MKRVVVRSFLLIIVLLSTSDQAYAITDWVDKDACDNDALNCGDRKFLPTFPSDNPNVTPVCRFEENGDEILGTVHITTDGQEVCKGARYSASSITQHDNDDFEFLILDTAQATWYDLAPESTSEYTRVKVSEKNVCRMLENDYSPKHVVGVIHSINENEVCVGTTYQSDWLRLGPPTGDTLVPPMDPVAPPTGDNPVPPMNPAANPCNQLLQDDIVCNDSFQELSVLQQRLSWPVKTYMDPIYRVSYIDIDRAWDSWHSWYDCEECTYDNHTGMDISVKNTRVMYPYSDDAEDLRPDAEVVAAASGKIIRMVTIEDDTCRWPKGIDGKYIKAASGEIVSKFASTKKRCGKGSNDPAYLNGNYGGNYVVIDHDPAGILDLLASKGFRYTVYCHLQKGDTENTSTGNELKIGDYVVRNQLIGKIGSSGNSTASHLHFEVGKKKGEKSFVGDPITAFSKSCQDSKWEDQNRLPIYGPAVYPYSTRGVPPSCQ